MPDDKSEAYELSRLGAVPTKNSGRGAFNKGDGILYDSNDEKIFTVDVKEYTNSYALSIKNIAKVSTDAVKNGTEPLLHVVLGSEEPRLRWVAIPESMFLLLWEAYNK
ncbi:Holliday junction resolvase [Rhodococcus phage Trina]|uniref:Holliday junction resolvase n=1 Tax=Rhodococcus phage Trina TaxID=2027905 RepID=A0A2D1A6N5_9CAUD|nr:Holliday junction resolvase [Rhodococcus phage Trina]ASZ74920.1 Holliday junction resolvase [Rhodococcus phage Trina]